MLEQQDLVEIECNLIKIEKNENLIKLFDKIKNLKFKFNFNKKILQKIYNNNNFLVIRQETMIKKLGSLTYYYMKNKLKIWIIT